MPRRKPQGSYRAAVRGFLHAGQFSPEKLMELGFVGLGKIGMNMVERSATRKAVLRSVLAALRKFRGHAVVENRE